MKKKALMVTVIMTLLGFLLLGVSVVFLYQGNINANSRASKTKKELDLAKKNIELLNLEVIKKISVIDSQLNNQGQLGASKFLDHNFPVVEITDTDLGKSDEDQTVDAKGKKVHKLMYSHQLRFYVFNVGKSSLQDVMFSIKDVYTDPKDIKKKSKVVGNSDDKDINNSEIGTYENFELNTIPLKTRRLVYSSTLPNSFGVGDYEFHIIVEWDQGFYQMHVTIEEIDGKLKYNYEYFDVNGKPLDMKQFNNN